MPFIQQAFPIIILSGGFWVRPAQSKVVKINLFDFSYWASSTPWGHVLSLKTFCWILVLGGEISCTGLVTKYWVQPCCSSIRLQCWHFCRTFKICNTWKNPLFTVCHNENHGDLKNLGVLFFTTHLVLNTLLKIYCFIFFEFSTFIKKFGFAKFCLIFVSNLFQFCMCL